MKSWASVEAKSDFSIYNIPFGICRKGDHTFAASRIGDQVIDLSKVANQGTFDHLGIEDGALTDNFLTCSRCRSINACRRQRLYRLL